jgi:nitrite reductase (cytochrome c-552)
MSDRSRTIRIAAYAGVLVVVAGLTAAVLYLALNVNDRKEEAEQVSFRVELLDESVIDPAVWGRNYPLQHDAYLRTVDTARTKYGGSEAFSRLEDDPLLQTIFAGYAFGIEYKEDRGHAYMLEDQEVSERVTQKPQPGACLHCHSSVLPAYYDQGVKAGAEAPEEGMKAPLFDPQKQAAINEGFAVVNALPYPDARTLVEHPVACIDCHDPDTMAVRVTRPGFLNGIAVLAASDEALPQYTSVGRWRSGDRETPYDPNELAGRQEMRTFACAQCHVEYYFKGEEKMLTYPWHDGLQADDIEAYYDETGWMDWEHGISGAPVLKAQHPEFETFSTGTHSRAGVACADCHMPYTRTGAVKISDHHIRSPLLNIDRACGSCHPAPAEEMKARAELIQDRTDQVLKEAETDLVALIEGVAAAQKAGATDEELAPARALQRRAQWRVDFVNAENSEGFHSPQETMRNLALALRYANQGLTSLPSLR